MIQNNILGQKSEIIKRRCETEEDKESIRKEAKLLISNNCDSKQ
jgi:hypothetical protein